MTFGTSPTDNNATPMSSVYVPGTANSDPTALEGIAVNTDGNGQKSSAARLGMLDGDLVTLGLKADTAATSDTGTFTLVSLVKRLLQKYQSTTTPMITEEQVQGLIVAGTGFSLVQEQIATGGANAFVGIQLIANNIAKNILVFRAWSTQPQAAGVNRLYQATTSTADSNLSDTLTPANIGGVATASALSSILGKNTTPTQTSGFQGTMLFSGGLSANVTLELLLAKQVLFIPKSNTGSVSIYSKVVTSGNTATVGLTWVEF